MASELAGSICDVYRVEESVRDVADVILALRDDDQSAAQTATRTLFDTSARP